MDKKEFTTEKGIKIQAEQLADWKTLLKEDVYNALEQFATATNHEATKGDDIRRGTTLDNFIANFNYRSNRVHNAIMKKAIDIAETSFSHDPETELTIIDALTVIVADAIEYDDNSAHVYDFLNRLLTKK